MNVKTCDEENPGCGRRVKSDAVIEKQVRGRQRARGAGCKEARAGGRVCVPVFEYSKVFMEKRMLGN